MKARPLAGAAGLLGGVACSTSMTLAALGVASVGAATAGATHGMAGMTSQPSRAARNNAILTFLLDHGPAILIASTALVVVALGLWHWRAGALAALTGTLMYWGMYVQGDLAVMYAAMAIGLLAWAALLLWPSMGSARSGRAIRQTG